MSQDLLSIVIGLLTKSNQGDGSFDKVKIFSIPYIYKIYILC